MDLPPKSPTEIAKKLFAKYMPADDDPWEVMAKQEGPNLQIAYWRRGSTELHEVELDPNDPAAIERLRLHVLMLLREEPPG